jgi:hypothetical protein
VKPGWTSPSPCASSEGSRPAYAWARTPTSGRSMRPIHHPIMVSGHFHWLLYVIGLQYNEYCLAVARQEK